MAKQLAPNSAFGLFDYRMLPKINRLLKAHGVRLKQRSSRKDWGDQVEITVEKLQMPTSIAIRLVDKTGKQEPVETTFAGVPLVNSAFEYWFKPTRRTALICEAVKKIGDKYEITYSKWSPHGNS